MTLSVQHTLQSFLRKSPPPGDESFECYAATGLEGEDPNWRGPSGWSAPCSPMAVTAISWSYAMNTRVDLAVVKGKHRETNGRYCEPRDGIATMGPGATADTARYGTTGRNGFAEFASSAHGAG